MLQYSISNWLSNLSVKRYVSILLIPAKIWLCLPLVFIAGCRRGLWECEDHVWLSNMSSLSLESDHRQFQSLFFYLSSFYVWRTNRSSLSLNLIIVNFDLGFFIFSMSGVGTCPHFLLNPITANFDLCFCHYHCNWLATIIIFTITTLFINPRNLFTLTLIQRHSNIVDSAISGPPECCPIFHSPLVRLWVICQEDIYHPQNWDIYHP